MLLIVSFNSDLRRAKTSRVLIILLCFGSLSIKFETTVEDQYNVAYNQDALRWLVLPMKLTLNACTWLLIDARDFFGDL